MKVFNKTNKKMTLSDKFDYLKNHFTYWTMNSWNGLKSIANNIKLWNLGLNNEQLFKAFEIICDEDLSEELWFDLKTYIRDFEDEHPGYQIYSNGRSDGYLVLMNEENNSNVLSSEILDYNSYKDAVKSLCEYEGYSYKDSQNHMRYVIERDFDLVVDFDKTCDFMLEDFVYKIDNCKIIEKQREVTKVVCYKTFSEEE